MKTWIEMTRIRFVNRNRIFLMSFSIMQDILQGRVFLQRLSFYQLCVSLGLQSPSHFNLKPKNHHSCNTAWDISPFSGDGAEEVDFTMGHCSATLMLGVNQRPAGCQHGAVSSTTSHFSPLQPMSFAGSSPQNFYCMFFYQSLHWDFD